MESAEDLLRADQLERRGMPTVGGPVEEKTTPAAGVQEMPLFFFRTDALGDVADHALPHFQRGVVSLGGRRVILHLRVEAEVFRLRHRRQVHDDSIAAHVYQSETRPVRGLSWRSLWVSRGSSRT